MKEIVDINLGTEDRQKVWKKISGKTKEETRYIRCLLLNINNKKYLIDSDQKEMRLFDEKEFEADDASFIPYKQLHREWDDYYIGV